MISSLTLPVTLATHVGDVVLRRATPADLDPLMALLADDSVSRSRGDRASADDRDRSEAVLAELLADATNDVLVVADGDGEVIGTMQVTRMPSLSRQAATRLQVETVRVSSRCRSGGVGSAMMRWVVTDAAGAMGATLVQLTSDAVREDAHRFYVRLGFTPSHVGFKLDLTSAVEPV